MTDLPLAEGFESASHEDWVKLAEQTLKGADFEKRLVSTTYDGLKLQPVYAKSDGLAIPARAQSEGWAILQRVDIPDIAEANAQALRDLEAGASGLTIVVDGHGGPSGFGVKAETPEDFERLLDGVYLYMIPVRLDAGAKTAEARTALLSVYEKKGIDASKLDLALGADPVSIAAIRAGQAEAVPGGGYLADGRIVHNAGGSEAQELAYTLASAVTYLRWLEAEGLSIDDAQDRVQMVLSVDADMFLSAAKFRAARLIWSRVVEACGAMPKPLKLHAETSWRMLAKRDPHVNLLRATAATFAASTAGADSLTVLPFTSAIGLPDRFARRMARNVQLVLAEESMLGHVQDPAAGSGFLDGLTNDLAEAAWSGFQKIEANGGIVPVIGSGALQSEVAETAAVRMRNIAKRKDALTGVSEFPNIHEAPAEVLAPLATASAGDGLVPMRVAEPFEALRDSTDAMENRPSIFLANIGSPADFTVRSTWAANLFEAGGIEAPQNDGFESTNDALAAFKASGSEIAAICSSDAVYAERAAEVAQSLTGAGAKHIFLAGRPDDDLTKAGVGTFVFAGCDILAVLQETHQMLGVSQ